MPHHSEKCEQQMSFILKLKVSNYLVQQLGRRLAFAWQRGSLHLGNWH
jgi:hypothetical protein